MQGTNINDFYMCINIIQRIEYYYAFQTVVKEKYPKSSFLAFHAYNGQHEWLILPLGIGSNIFKLLCIEVIFKYNTLFLIDD